MAETTDLQKLVVRLEAQTAQFERQLNKATASANRSAKQIETRFQTMQRGIGRSIGLIGSTLGSLGIGIGVSALVSGFRNITAAADDLVDTANRIDFPIARLKAFQNVVALNGGSVEQATAALDKFALNVADAATKGGPLADVFEANGIAIRNAAGEIRPIEDLLDDYIALMGRAANATERGKFAAVAFGKANTEIAGALGKGTASVAELNAEVERLGPNFEEQQKRLAEANDTIDVFLRSIGEYATIAAAEGIKALQDYGDQVDALGEVTRNFVNDPSVRTLLDLLFGKGAGESVLGAELNATSERMIELEAAAKNAEEQITKLQAEINETREIMGDAKSSMVGDWVDVAEKGIAYAEKKLAFYKAQLASIPQLQKDALNASIVTGTWGSTAALPAAPAPGVTGPPAVLPVKVDNADEVGDAAAKSSKRSQGELADQLTRAIGAWETRGMTMAQAYAARGAAGEYGRYQIMEANIGPWSRERYGYSVSPATFAANPQIQDEIARYKIGQYLDKYGLEGAIRSWNTGQPGGTTTAGYVPGVMGMLESGAGFDFAGATEGMKELGDATALLIDRMAEVRGMSEDFLNTFVDGLLEGKSAVEALADALEDLGRSLIRSGIHMLVGSIFPTPTAGAGLLGAPTGGGFLGSIFGRQTGGPIEPGSIYRVHKDELIVPRGPGTVIPAGAARRIGSGDYALTYSPSIVIQGNADEAAIRTMRDRMLIDIEQRLPSMVRSAHRDRRL